MKVKLTVVIIFLFFLPIGLRSQVQKGGISLEWPSSIDTIKRWSDKNGHNELRIKIDALCIPGKTIPMGFESKVKVILRNANYVIGVRSELAFDEYQMMMVAFFMEDVCLVKVKGVHAVFIPFFYCGNMDSEMRVSYIIIYNDKKYMKHIRFDCAEDGKCKLKDDMENLLRDMPSSLRNALIKQLKRYERISDFHKER